MLLYMTQSDTTAVLLIISLFLITFSTILFITNTFKHRSFKNKVAKEVTEIDKTINENVTFPSDAVLQPNDWQLSSGKNLSGETLFSEVDATIVIPPHTTTPLNIDDPIRVPTHLPTSNEHFTVQPGNLVASTKPFTRFIKISDYLLQSKYANIGITSSSDHKKTLQEFIDKGKPKFNCRVFFTNKNNKELAKDIGISESQLSFYFTDRPIKEEIVYKINTHIISNYEYLDYYTV